MSLTTKSLKNPAAVIVVALIAMLLGATAVVNLPMQLFPKIERPQISVTTSWRSASPREIEAEINEPIEEVLQGIPGVEEMVSNAGSSFSFVNLTFVLGTDMNKAMLDVISRLNRLPPMPRDSDPPQVSLGGFTNDAESLIWYFVQALPENPNSIGAYRSYIEDAIIPKLESVDGVASAQVFSFEGADELQVEFDPFRAAELGINLANITTQIGRSTDVSGGFADVGRRQYTLRFQGRYEPSELEAMILTWRNGSPVTLGDIATIGVGPGRSQSVAYQNGNPALSIQLIKDSDANVLATLARVKELVAQLNETELPERQLYMEKSFDPSVFIMRAINLLTGNLFLGVLLAVGGLWWFLRQARATIIIAIAIPISLLTTLFVLWITGRTMNAISLAGLAFATGMVLDAAIVVLENIVRLKEREESEDFAAEEGAKQVWGALLASTATTVAIFIPVIFLKDAEGQLFADLALTIAIGVSISLFVAVTILPTAARYWLKKVPPADDHEKSWDRISKKIIAATNSNKKRMIWIASLVTLPFVATYLMWPQLNYLPPTKRDAVDTFFILPAGTTLETLDKEFAQVVMERTQPYLDGTKEPKLLNYYLMSFGGFNGGEFAVRAADQDEVDELLEVVTNELVVGFPDIQTFTRQGSLFGGFGSSENIAIHIQNRDPEILAQASLLAAQLVREQFGPFSANPQPDPNAGTPEIRLVPNDQRISEVGWTRAQVGSIVRALGDGLWLGEHFDGDKRLDIIFKAAKWNTPEALESIPLATPSGQVVMLGDLVDIRRDVGPVGIQRREGRRTMSVIVNPPGDMALEQALTILQTEVEPKVREVLSADGNIFYGGSADSMNKAIKTLGTNFLLALGLLFMIMAALFRSPKDAMMVVIAIPLAAVGGIATLQILNLFTFQPLDLLTMIGFIILLGLVVNNAILLVVETRRSENEGLSRQEAVQTALRLRLRPIFMSTLTSIFGILPLLLLPGTGSEIYRGMAAAIVGGMSVSTLFTLILLPCLLQMGREEEVAILDSRQAAE